MATGVDKFTEKLADVEIRNTTSDEKIQDIVDLFRMTYSGFHELQQHIAQLMDATLTMKLQQTTKDIDTMMKLMSDNIATMSREIATRKSQVTHLESAARQIGAIVQQLVARKFVHRFDTFTVTFKNRREIQRRIRLQNHSRPETIHKKEGRISTVAPEIQERVVPDQGRTRGHSEEAGRGARQKSEDSGGG